MSNHRTLTRYLREGRRLPWAVLALLTLGGCAAPQNQSPDKSLDQSCQITDLKGRYVASGTLTNAPGSSRAGSTAYIQALFSFDGAGDVEVTKGLSTGSGSNVGWEGEGHYSLEADCFGEINLSTTVAGSKEAKMELDFLVRKVSGEIVLESILVIQPGKTSGQLTLRKAAG